MALALTAAVDRIDAAVRLGIRFRIGIHCGPVVAGVIGTKKFIYDIWGDTVNLASRMESLGVPGRIQVTHAVKERLEGRFLLEPRGLIDVKGKGPTPTWYLVARDEASGTAPLPDGRLLRSPGPGRSTPPRTSECRLVPAFRLAARSDCRRRPHSGDAAATPRPGEDGQRRPSRARPAGIRLLLDVDRHRRDHPVPLHRLRHLGRSCALGRLEGPADPGRPTWWPRDCCRPCVT